MFISLKKKRINLLTVEWPKVNSHSVIKSDSQLVSALLLLYDVTNKTSYDNIRAWLSEIREHANDDVVIMLLGE